jgi:hypothetical protein
LGADFAAKGKRCRFCVDTLKKWPCWPLYNETHPVTAEELLLRSVPNVGGNVYDGKALDAAFQPRPDDTDGLSLQRLDFITPEQMATANKHARGVFIVMLLAQNLMEMGLTLLPSPAELAGHVVIPEMRYGLYQAKETKGQVKDFMHYLRMHANRRSIWGPSSPLPIQKNC